MTPPVLLAALLGGCTSDPSPAPQPDTRGQDSVHPDSGSPDSDSPDSGAPEAGLATLQGYVRTTDGEPVPDAQISVGEATTSTNALGFFTLRDLPPGEVVIHAEAEGFSTTSAVRTLIGDTWTYAGLNVVPAEVLSWDATAGGTLETSNGVVLRLPSGGLVDSFGEPVTGQVSVAVALLNSADTLSAAPGALMADRGGEDALLKSLGMVEVRLTDEAGLPVQISEPARISFPVATTLDSPDEFSLFGFDESTGRWQEAGEASIANGLFLATVEHFSWWNCDAYENTDQCVTGVVTTSDGPLVNATLSVEEYGRLTRGSFTTDADGRFTIPLPAGGEVQIGLEYGAYSWSSDPFTLPDEEVPESSRPAGCVDLGEVLAVSDDEDGDGFPSVARGGPDCDDGDASINPDAIDAVYSGVDEDCDGEDDYDQDQDGYVPDAYVGLSTATVSGSGALPGGDCDDEDPWTNPGRVEFCDGDDDNCSGDERDATDAATWYQDLDGDGYGDDASATASCTTPGDDWVNNGGDCAETGDDPSRYHPGADELCGELVDYNCDGSVDDADADADGALACEDCDDHDSATAPGAPELCDREDNDCDGEIDEGATDLSVFYRDYDADGFGDGETAITDCEAPAGYVLDAGAEGVDCDDRDADRYPGAPEICEDGVVQDCAGSTDAALAECAFSGDVDLSLYDTRLLGEESGDGAGRAVKGAVDVNGDGWPDLLVGAPDQAPLGDGVERGAAYLVLGPVTADADLSSAEAKLTGRASGDDAGAALAGGDVNGDGYDDVLVGAPYNGEGAGRGGAVSLMFGPITGTTALDSADTKLLGDTAYGEAGTYLAITSDVDGDGLGDVLVGNRHVLGGGGYGQAYLMFGPVSAGGDLSSADVTLTTQRTDASVAGAGDVDGDGLGDLWIGCSYYNGSLAEEVQGAIYLELGPVVESHDLSDADAALYGEEEGDHAGEALDAAGDVDGDGRPDLVIGSQYHESAGRSSGAAYLVLSPVTGAMDLSAADARMTADAKYDFAGVSVAGAGDANGDGFDDLLVGASGEDSGGSAAGAAYLVLGPVTGEVDLADAQAKLIGEDAGDQAGISVASAGDMDADGKTELLIGADQHEEGAIYLISDNSF